MVLQYFTSSISGGVILSAVGTLVHRLVSFVNAALAIMIFTTISADLDAFILQCAVALCVPELLTSVTLSHMISVRHTASAEVNEHLKV